MNIAIGIVVIITYVVVRLTVISPAELVAFVIAIVGMPIAVGSHGRLGALHDRAGCPTVLHLLHT
jgi:hypothetical protein